MGDRVGIVLIVIIWSCLAVVCSHGVKAQSNDFEDCTDCLEVTFYPGDDIRYFRFIDQVDEGPKDPNNVMYDLELFNGCTVRHHCRFITRILLLELTDQLKEKIELQMVEKPWNFQSKPEKPLGNEVDLTRVTNPYYRRMIDEKIVELDRYRDEKMTLKKRAIVRWRNKGGQNAPQGHVNFENYYGRHDLDGTKKIKDLNEKMETCRSEAIRIYNDFIRKL